ncbi:hypothetical protein TBLA_0F01750 [Henningerozyma blattae CBS 6284]|uniref:Conserved oligomeric Golgi complex subunit 4 n=1 Tax=Henningerozyma blattae (strain ATCC 34711 / CBS 6284 / DSM 70876 / NBRC 10599 / NRRL Y-10934 / UCD 77-7) TaxID=1071380 RepID=I2H5R5_HENB6|nr:hypothetical protein TBLA_0F01750 [Tetrapisispora blattae CBS 6284]CCH61717.1 hypothetical protein TBLA_0F01750 [Tetrapisispora blattae CBS 6284]
MDSLTTKNKSGNTLSTNSNEIPTASWDTLVLDGQLSKNLAKYNQLIEKITTQSQVTKLHSLIINDHLNQSNSLSVFISNIQLNHNKDLRKLELKRTDLTNTLSNFQSSLSTVSKTNNVTSLINSNIQSIDLQRSLIKKTLKFLSHVRTLKNDIILIHSALLTKDYLVAAKAISEVRSLPPDIIDSTFVKKTVPSSEIPEIPRILIDNWCKELTDLFKSKFIDAARSKNIEDLTLMFKMFPMVGENTLGLDLYSKYICDIIANESRKIITDETNKNSDNGAHHINPSKIPGFYAKVILHLFKIVSTVINEHSKIISTSYGNIHMIHVMEKIEKETDLQTGLVLDIFLETRKVDRILSEINEWNDLHSLKIKNLNKSLVANTHHTREKSSSPSIHGKVSSTEKNLHSRTNSSNENNIQDLDSVVSFSINDLSLLIDEFSQILQNWSMYARFFSIRWNEFSDIKFNILQPPPPIANSQFVSKLSNENLLNNFESLVVHNLYRSFDKSLKIEDLPSLNDYIINDELNFKDISSNPISSVVEDLTLFIRRNLISTVNTGQFSVLDNFLNQLAKFIQNEFLVKFMQSKFKFLQSRLNTSTNLKKYTPKSLEPPPNSTSLHPPSSPPRSNSPASFAEKYASSTLSQFGFNFRGAAANALTNIQSNLQAVVSDEESVLALHHYLIYVNTLFVEIIFIHKLLIEETIEDNPTMLKDNFPFNNEFQEVIIKLKNCEKLIIRQTEKLQKWSIKYLFENIVKSKIRSLLIPLFINGTENSYIAGAEDFEDMTTVNEFITKWKPFIVPYKNILCTDAYNELLSYVVQNIVTVLEDKIMLLKVNELGAAKLDRELSLFIATICSLNYVLREKFTKLTQIVLLLGFDEDDMDPNTNDLKEEIKSSITWVLSPQERIKIRKIKVD